jgi:hypothetical protein
MDKWLNFFKDKDGRIGHRQVNFYEGKKECLVNFRRKESGKQLIAKFL